MKVSLIGSNGSMGKRYQSILNFLGHTFEAFDLETSPFDIRTKSSDCDAIILATPTVTHAEFLLLLEKCKKPILCEKPLSTNRAELQEIKWLCQRGMNLTMMMQYRFLDNPNSSGDTYYNYFRHGNDGLSWDCLQLIALARGKVEIKEDSPIWTCILNGMALSLDNMDEAYISSVETWLQKPGQDIDEILSFHHKVAQFEELHGLPSSS